MIILRFLILAVTALVEKIFRPQPTLRPARALAERRLPSRKRRV